MKRAAIIIVAGFLAAAAGYSVLYFAGTKKHREMLGSPAPELAWLKNEFQLGDAEFERVVKLHDGYLPFCAELCQRIAAKNAELAGMIGAANVDLKAMEQKLKETADLRVECQKNMLRHFLEVSREMPPEQGRRYLKWVQQRTLTSDQSMAQRHAAKIEMGHH